MLNVNSPIVDKDGRMMRPFYMMLAQIVGGNTGSNIARITALEGAVATLDTRVDAVEISVSAQAVSIAANGVAITALQTRASDLEIDSLWVTPWPVA